MVEVHASHCCKMHGCKYGNADCPVVLDLADQTESCENCEIEGSRSIESVESTTLKEIQEILWPGGDLETDRSDMTLFRIETAMALGGFKPNPPEPPPRINTKAFEGKTIRSVDTHAMNVTKFHFTDGTSAELETERVMEGFYTMVSVK